MNSIKRLEADGIYLIQGRPVAKNVFFENSDDVSLAHVFVKRYLADMMDILDYQFSAEGWVFIVRTKSAKRIQDSYLNFRSRSMKAKKACIKTTVAGMISEHIRYFLSQLVRKMNQLSGRTGTKVHRVFERYIFDSYEECKAYMNRMREERVELCQQLDRYKASSKDSEVMHRNWGKRDSLMCSYWGIKRAQLIVLQRVTRDVLENLIKRSKSCLLPRSHPKTPSKFP